MSGWDSITMQIEEQIKKINIQLFHISTVLVKANGNGQHKAVCPKCQKEHIHIIANHKFTKLYCSFCFWEEYYMRINKRGEDSI